MLEPGTWLETTKDGAVRSGRFFEFPSYHEPDLHGEEAYEAVDAAVTDAVRRHMVSDVPLGTFLSGGIDSPLVAAKMRALDNKTVRGFTIGTNGDPLDETSDAVTYAREIGVEHHVDQLTSDRAADLLSEVVTACGEPFADYSIFPTLLVSRLARQQVKVMLSGDGGDELFWGYAERFSPILEKMVGGKQPGGAGSTAWNSKKSLDAGASIQGLRGPADIGHFYRLKHMQISEDWLNRIFPNFPGWPTDFALFTYAGCEPDRTAQWLRWNEFVGHLTMVLLKVDRGSMYNSLEVRVPLLDKELVKIAGRVEWRSCLDAERRIGKLPLRHSLARHMNHQTWTKRGFTVSMDRWLRGPLRKVFEEVMMGRSDVLGFPINHKALREMFELHLCGQANYAKGLWTILSLALWEERHYRLRQSFVH
jgi:asparagine synthase (glutamine-hydrolysing)